VVETSIDTDAIGQTMKRRRSTQNAVDREQAIWNELRILLNHMLPATLVFAMTSGIVALMQFLRSHFGLVIDAAGFVRATLKWMEFVVAVFNSLLFSVFSISTVRSFITRVFRQGAKRRGAAQ